LEPPAVARAAAAVFRWVVVVVAGIDCCESVSSNILSRTEFGVSEIRRFGGVLVGRDLASARALRPLVSRSPYFGSEVRCRIGLNRIGPKVRGRRSEVEGNVEVEVERSRESIEVSLSVLRDQADVRV
jgi:hypothetical protein